MPPSLLLLRLPHPQRLRLTQQPAPPNRTTKEDLSRRARPPLQFHTLDVFGFESVRNVQGAPGVAAPGNPASAVNGLEQLLINVANEELQNLFTETAVVDFCEELVREGVDASAAALSSGASGDVSPGGAGGASSTTSAVAPRALMGDEINALIKHSARR